MWRCLQIRGDENMLHVFLNWEPVDPVVADPVRQDNDKRNNYKYIRKFPIKVHRGRGQNFPIFIFVVILSNWVWDDWVYRLLI